MKNLEKITGQLEGTREAEVLKAMDQCYEKVQDAQQVWYKKSEFFCPDGCGECCRNFEPDLLECEAVYMAAWIIENEPEVAEELCGGGEFPFKRGKGCQFWNENAEYHCSIYGGRPFICRFFGACGSHSKTGETVFKPCKFYPAEKLKAYKIPLAHRQYSQNEIEQIFGTLPPVMNDLMESAIAINPDNFETELVRNILPDTIRKLKWICQMNSK